MARTDSASVLAVLNDDYGTLEDGTSPSLTPFITAANLLTTRVATCAEDRDWELSSDELLAIETWLAAHFYAMNDQVRASRSTQGANASFQGQTGMHLESSKYGQTAMVLDTSGCLTALSKRQRVHGLWLGKPPSEQTDYVDRD